MKVNLCLSSPEEFNKAIGIAEKIVLGKFYDGNDHISVISRALLDAARAMETLKEK